MKYIIKTILTASVLMSHHALTAQDIPFTVEGRLVSSPAPEKIFLYYGTGDERVKDSALVQNGVFSLQGKISEPLPATLLNGRDMLSFYLEEGVIRVKADSTLATAVVTGGKTNRSYLELKQALEPLRLKSKALSREERAAKEEVLEAERKAVLAAFVKYHPNTVVSLRAISDYGGFFPEAKDVEPLYELLSEKVKQSVQGKQYAAALAKMKKTAIGAAAPVFEKKDPSGKPISIADFRGKYLLIDFWASWCKPCRAENPHVVKAYNKYKDQNFEILGVTLDTERLRDAWLKAVAEDGLTWPQVIDLGEEKASDLYNVQAIPQNFLLDPEGLIIAKNLRGEELESKLAEVLE